MCLLPAPADPAWMQAVARDMNLSETAFLHEQDGAFALRWFMPATEVDLYGHATLAAHVLWEIGRLSSAEPALFDARSGRLTATRQDQWITLDFPSEPATPVVPPPALIEALGAPAAFVGRNRMDLGSPARPPTFKRCPRVHS